MYRNDQFSEEEIKMAQSFKQKFNSLTMTVISFWEVDFTYDQKFVTTSIEECRKLLQDIIARHLTDKSKGRVDLVFNTLGEPDFLNTVFKKQDPIKSHMDSIVQDLHKLIDEGSL